MGVAFPGGLAGDSLLPSAQVWDDVGIHCGWALWWKWGLLALCPHGHWVSKAAEICFLSVPGVEVQGEGAGRFSVQASLLACRWLSPGVLFLAVCSWYFHLCL